MADFLHKLRVAAWMIVIDIWNLIKLVIQALGPVSDSIRGIVNEREMYRTLSTAMAVSGSFWSLLQFLYHDASTIVTDPTVLAAIQAFVSIARHNYMWATIFIVIFVGDYYRRKYTHGQ